MNPVSGVSGNREGKEYPLASAAGEGYKSIPRIFSGSIVLITTIAYCLASALGLPDVVAHLIIGAYVLGGMISMLPQEGRWSKPTIDRRFIFFILVCACVVATGLVAHFLRRPDVRIITPRNQTGVASGKVTIVGVAKKLHSGSHVWLVVYGPTKVFIPQKEVVPDQDGMWDGEVNLWAANCGYEVWAVVVSQAGHEWLATNTEFTVWYRTPESFSKVLVLCPPIYPSGG